MNVERDKFLKLNAPRNIKYALINCHGKDKKKAEHAFFILWKWTRSQGEDFWRKFIRHNWCWLDGSLIRPDLINPTRFADALAEFLNSRLCLI